MPVGMASVTNNQLCKVCQLLVFRISSKPGCGSLQLHSTFELLEERSKSACGICVELLRSLRDGAVGDAVNPLASLFPVICEYDTSSASWQSSFDVVFKLSKSIDFSLRFIFEIVENTESELNHKATFFEITNIFVKTRQSDMHPHRLQTLLKAGS
jgi:hypothetical protein